jgi:hypothetical protein
VQLASDERKGLAAVLTLLSDESVGDVVRSALLDVLEDVLHPLVRLHHHLLARTLEGERMTREGVRCCR